MSVGLLGQHGSCIVCLTGTDTALAFTGEPEWCIAGLVNIGVPYEEAIATFEDQYYPRLPGWLTVTYRVCRKCLRDNAPAEFPDPALIIGDIPCITQPAGVRP